MLVPLSVNAASLGIGPAQLMIKDAIRGQTYRDTLFIRHTDETSTSRLQLLATGDIADWVSFYEQGQTIALGKEIRKQTGEWVYLTVQFSIPKNTQLTSANGTLQVMAIPEGAEAGMAVGLMGKIDVAIQISGVPQKIEGKVDKIAIERDEILSGQPVYFQVYFTNSGDANVEPKTHVKVFTGNNNLVAEFEKQSNIVSVGKQQLIMIPWSTPGLAAGYYVAEVEVTLEGKVMATKKVQFAVLPQTSVATGKTASQEVKADGDKGLSPNSSATAQSGSQELKSDVTTDKGFSSGSAGTAQSASQEVKSDVTADRGLSSNSGAAAQSASQQFSPNEIAEKGSRQAPDTASQPGGLSFPIINLAAVAALLVVFSLIVRFQKRRT